MDSKVPTRPRLKVVRATRRLNKKIVYLFGRRGSQEIEVPSFRRVKRRFYLDIDKLRMLIQRRYCEDSVHDAFYRLERKLTDRVVTEITFREEMNIQDSYYGHEFKIHRKPYVRGNRPRVHEHTTSRGFQRIATYSSRRIGV